MKIKFFAPLVLLSTLALAGCGDQKTANRGDNSSGPKNESSSASSADGPASDDQKVKVESTLPFKDLDPATAAKGVDPGRILIDAEGQDSSGQPISLADYRGKVILLDTWASW